MFSDTPIMMMASRRQRCVSMHWNRSLASAAAKRRQGWAPGRSGRGATSITAGRVAPAERCIAHVHAPPTHFQIRS